MRNQRVRTGTPTGNGPPDPTNETAARAGTRNGGKRKEARLKLQRGSYHNRVAIEKVVEADRRFFQRRPERTHRARIASQAEISEMGATPLPAHLRWFAVVRQVVPGARLRLLFPCYRDADPDIVSEARCAAIYAAVTREAM